MQGIQEQIMINIEQPMGLGTEIAVWVTIAAGVVALLAAFYKVFKWYIKGQA